MSQSTVELIHRLARRVPEEVRIIFPAVCGVEDVKRDYPELETR